MLELAADSERSSTEAKGAISCSEFGVEARDFSTGFVGVGKHVGR